MKKSKQKITGNHKQITYARTIVYPGRKMSEIKNFYGLWYWFYLLD